MTKKQLRAEELEELKGQRLVYFMQSLCSNNHSVTMILGEYEDPAKAGEELSKLMAEWALQQCPECHSSELHFKFCRTRFHSKVELEAWKAQLDARN